MLEAKTGAVNPPFPLGIISGDEPEARALNVVCVGAHPDDPETGCGGTLAKLAQAGHQIDVIYLTRGEAGIREGNHDKTGQLRTREALRGVQILKGSAYFAGQIDGNTKTDKFACRRFADLLFSRKPDIVFTHWPLDTHADHRNAAQLTYQAWQWANESFALAYYEVMTGIQTHHFKPNWFVDISLARNQKRDAIYAHVSQNPDRFYPYHEAMERQRGSEANCECAEAFFVMREKSPKPLMPFAI